MGTSRTFSRNLSAASSRQSVLWPPRRQPRLASAAFITVAGVYRKWEEGFARHRIFGLPGSRLHALPTPDSTSRASYFVRRRSISRANRVGEKSIGSLHALVQSNAFVGPVPAWVQFSLRRLRTRPSRARKHSWTRGRVAIHLPSSAVMWTCCRYHGRFCRRETMPEYRCA
jgi:hypothetical protein